MSDENDSLPPWERVAAAIGCAIREPGKDDTPAVVFKRADDAMYRHKNRMKKDGSVR